MAKKKPTTKTKKSTVKQATVDSKKVVDPILLKASKLFAKNGNATPAERDTAFNQLADLLVPVTSIVLRDDYVNLISKTYNISATVFKSLITSKEKEAKRIEEEKANAVPVAPMPKTLHEYITNNETPGILWKAKKLLTGVDSPVERSTLVADICRTIALIPAAQRIVKDDYLKKIATDYGLVRKSLDKLVEDHTVIETKKSELTRAARKNTLDKLDSNPKTFPFFYEKFTINRKDNTRVYKGIEIDIKKYLQFLLSFGFMRYGNDTGSTKFNFIRMSENVINEVNIEELKDFFEDYLENEYDYKGAGCEEVDADLLINFFLNNMKKYFTHDVFARLRSRKEIIISADTEKECFLYFKNGFACVTKEGTTLLDYDKMDGSVWQKQMLDRDFKLQPLLFEKNGDDVDWENSFSSDRPLGDYADFIWRISGQKQQRFISLCTILGYLIHDYYDYKLKAIILTDSTVSESSEGRTGKTLSLQMLGNVRSYCEINGKQFNPEDERKYQYADLSTQVMHINDVQHKGRYKFDLESLFNDITEGYWVRKMFMAPFHKKSKIAVSTNRSIDVKGASMRDRIVEFEMSAFFNEHRSPATYYGKWMGKGWNENDWTQFDNFICFCAQAFLNHGIVAPETINLEARKLLDGTCREFLEFMSDITETISTTGNAWDGYQSQTGTDFTKITDIRDFEFDKKKLFERFIALYPDYNNKFFTQRKFTDWLKRYAHLQLNVKEPVERRSNGVFFIQFKEIKPKQE